MDVEAEGSGYNSPVQRVRSVLKAVATSLLCKEYVLLAVFWPTGLPKHWPLTTLSVIALNH